MKTRKAFTLVELLVVIAVIAILVAILVPVFSKVREQARATTSISNLHQISTALEQYKLDYHQYPKVLFGYAFTGDNMNNAYQNHPQGFTNSLYPRYVKDAKVFLDPDNSANLSDQTGVTTFADGTVNLFKADAYDSSPLIAGNSKLDTTVPNVVRYQLAWTDINAGFGDNTAPVTSGTTTTPGGLGNQAGLFANGENNYARQLRWRSQPGDTYVTSSTYHVPQTNSVLVLFESGNVKKVDSSVFLSTGSSPKYQPDAQVNPVAVGNSSAKVSTAHFWMTSEN